MILTYILIALYLLLLIMFAIKYKIFFILASPILLYRVWLIISCAYLETEEPFLEDTLVTAYRDGATIRLLVLEFSFLISLFLISRLFYKKVLNKNFDFFGKNHGPVNVSIVEIIFLLVNIYLLLDTTISGNVYTNSSITRFTYFSNYSTLPFVNEMSYFIMPLQICNGLIFVTKRRVKYLCLINLAFAVLFLFLIGNQANQLFLSLIYFFIPFLIKLTFSYEKEQDLIKKRKFRRIIYLSIISVAVLVYITVLTKAYISSYTQGITYDKALGNALYRFLALESNTWWCADNLVYNSGYNDLAHIKDEIGYIFQQVPNTSTGIWYIMKNIMPDFEYARFVDGNCTLNAGYDALQIMMFGYVGSTITTFFNGMIYCLFIYLFYIYLYNKSYIEIILFFFVLLQINKIYSMGGIGYYFNLLPMLSTVILGVIHFTKIPCIYYSNTAQYERQSKVV